MTTLSDGLKQLANGSGELYSGIGTLKEGSAQLTDGVKLLADGAKELDDGMKKFKTEAVDKIMKVYNDEIKGLMDKLSAVTKASGAYNNFSGIADGTEGEVKFIFETEGITSKNEK
jgi:putative membrane protein